MIQSVFLDKDQVDRFKSVKFNLFLAISIYFFSFSIPIQLRPYCFATIAVVPLPKNGVEGYWTVPEPIEEGGFCDDEF